MSPEAVSTTVSDSWESESRKHTADTIARTLRYLENDAHAIGRPQVARLIKWATAAAESASVGLKH